MMLTTTAKTRVLPAVAAILLSATMSPAGALAASAPSAGAVSAAPSPAEPTTSTATTTTSAATTTSNVATPEPQALVGSGPVTLRTHSFALLGSRLDFAGTAPAKDRGKTITIERSEPATASWIVAASSTIGPHGAFIVHWRTNLTGRISVRAVVAPAGSSAARATQSLSSAATQVTVYQPALSTWFGPGFFGRQTACGQTLEPWVVGVANRTLPCGTLVEVSYAGKRLTVPVIDRGPYANGADWDLTAGAAEALGITETVRIGTLVVGAAPNSPTLGTPPGSPTTETSATTGGAAA